jgi:cytochrome c553
MDVHPNKGNAPFMRLCSSCHGLKAQGDAEHAIPALAGQRFNYLVRQMANFGSAERDNAAMYHVIADKGLAEPQMWVDVASYLSRLAPTVDSSRGDGANVARGGSIFLKQCAICHDSSAGGDKDGFVPSLRHQHYQYLVKQLHRLADGHRHNADPSLLSLMRSLDEGDVSSVADYLSRLRVTSTGHERMLSNGVVVD